MALTYTSDIVIDAPMERVFAAITEVDGFREWMPNLVSVEPLTPGDLRVGSEWRETRKMFGTTGSEVFEVTALDPPKSIGLRVDGARGTTGKGEYRFDFRVEPAGAGTRLTLDGQVSMANAGWFTRMMSGLITGVFKKACVKDMRALKAYLEGGGGKVA